MTDRWYYMHDGSTEGPVSPEVLKQLAAVGDLAPTDLLWLEGSPSRCAVKALSVLDAAAFGSGSDSTGVWVGKVTQSLANSPDAPAATPDWLADLQEAVSRPSPAVASSAPAVAPRQVVSYPPCLTLGTATTRGKVRVSNDDRFQICHWNGYDGEGTEEIALIVVADGMGGYQGGGEASSLTVGTVVNDLMPLIQSGRQRDDAVIAATIDQAIREANRAVHGQGKKESRWKDMAATVAVVILYAGRAYFSHVGDCRVYLHRHHELKQLTEDQVVEARPFAGGKAAVEKVSRNEIIQALGKRPTITPSRASRELQAGDYLLAASDGLGSQMDLALIQQALDDPTIPAHHLAHNLVSLADEAGGKDNCTVVVAHFS